MRQSPARGSQAGPAPTVLARPDCWGDSHHWACRSLMRCITQDQTALLRPVEPEDLGSVDFPAHPRLREVHAHFSGFRSGWVSPPMSLGCGAGLERPWVPRSLMRVVSPGRAAKAQPGGAPQSQEQSLGVPWRHGIRRWDEGQGV
jgi:hypothetical protein